ncbi:hypothetical protein BDV96DRAFT_642682 [Lophiotrema nucula]|uniref:ChrR-like cupin domain-containing protein n=1 Tax=Lophiotrema nucula TaxID=690887 RepID=A0A6A5ZMI5_9PLEO|nr:hypothetical protein BDV96DRAFT_642682 [Lophiotrema nucula]
MPKLESEFKPASSIASQASHNGTLTQRVLSHDSDTGDKTVLLAHSPGAKWGNTEDDETSTCIHEYWEECYIIEGRLYDVGKKLWFEAGSYCCRPPGMVHGPYRADEVVGCREVAWVRYPAKTV